MAEITRDFVATVFVVKDRKVLLVKHKKLSLWLPPGGHIETNETPEQAAMREIKEETGLDIELKTEKFHKIQILKPHHVEVHPISETHEHICFVYFTKPTGGEMQLNKDEHDEIKWFSLEELGKANINIEVRHFAEEAIRWSIEE